MFGKGGSVKSARADRAKAEKLAKEIVDLRASAAATAIREAVAKGKAP